MTLDTSPGEGLGLMWRVRGLETGPDWSILLMIIMWTQLGPALLALVKTSWKDKIFR